MAVPGRCGPGRTPVSGIAAPSLAWPWAKAGELTQAWNDSSSRQRVTTSQMVRSSVGREELEALEAVLVVDGSRRGPRTGERARRRCRRER